MEMYGNVRLCPSRGGICSSYEEVLASSTVRGALNKPYALKTAYETDRPASRSYVPPGLYALADGLRMRYTSAR